MSKGCTISKNTLSISSLFINAKLKRAILFCKKKIYTGKNPKHLKQDSEAYSILLESHLITIKNSLDSFKTSDCNSIGVM